MARGGRGVPVESDAEPQKKESRFMPYQGRESLPPFELIEKGKDGRADRIKYGAPRFAMHRGERGTVKVLAYFRSPRGVVRKVYAVLKPTTNRPKDAALLKELKAAGITSPI